VRKTIGRGSADQEVHKHWDCVTGVWKQISKQRQRVNISYDPSMVMALRHDARMDKERFKKTCIKEIEKKGGIDQSFYCTWVAVFMLRQDAGKFMLRKYLN